MARRTVRSATIIIWGLLLAVACQARVAATPNLGTGPLGNPDAYLQRGDEYAAAQAYALAVADYSQALKLRPAWAEAYNNRGYSYWWNGQVDAALADYNQALALRPNYAFAYNNRGVLYMAGGQTALAIADFTRAIELQPDFPQAYRNRGNAYLRLGQFGPARADLSRVGADPAPWLLAFCGGLGLIAAAAVLALRRRRGPRLPPIV